MTSFSRTVRERAGGAVRLRCGAAGSPPPHRVWSRRRPAPPVHQDRRFLVEGQYLVILSQYLLTVVFIKHNLNVIYTRIFDCKIQHFEIVSYLLASKLIGSEYRLASQNYKGCISYHLILKLSITNQEFYGQTKTHIFCHVRF